ncbi:MAG: hypothetical protein JKX71_10620 [Amylibacter sp.]|nr:hypothetical protein [Amylibacter sp.]
MSKNLDKDQIDGLLGWYSAEADRAMFNIQLLERFFDSEIDNGFFYSHLGRVTRHIIPSSGDALIMFIARCWDRTKSTDKLEKLKKAILCFGYEHGNKNETENSIRKLTLLRFPEIDSAEAQKRAKEDFDAITCAFEKWKLASEIRIIRNGYIAHIDWSKITSSQKVELLKLLNMAKDTIEIIQMLEKAWTGSERSGRPKIAKLASETFWIVMKDNQGASHLETDEEAN